MDTQQAFSNLLLNRWNDLPPSDKYLWKHRFNKKELSNEKIESILKSFGYKKVRTELWKSK